MYRLMKHISESMLIQSERSMDLLLGMIVMIGYHQYHCFFHGQLSNLVGLAVTLVGDLGLRNPPEKPNFLTAKTNEVQGRTNEEKRAFAGVWFLSSS